MARRTTRVIGVCVLAISAVLGQDLKGAKAVDTPVTSTLQTTGSVGSSTNYRIQNDGLGAYTNFSTRRPADQVVSILQTSNVCCQDWELDTQSSTSRSILFDFRDPAPGTLVTDAPFDVAVVPGRVLVQCHLAGVNMPAMTLGQSVFCPVVLNLSDGGSALRISLGHSGQPGTDSALVTCTNADSGNKCNRWTTVPTGSHDGEVKNVGRLLLVGKNGSTTALGDFYFTFSFITTRP